MSSKQRQHNYRKDRIRRTLKRNRIQEQRLPSEEFTERDFARMERQARQARQAMNRSRARMNGGA